MSADRYDAVVAGGGIAGCTAARLLGLAGLRVALAEQRPDPDAYKVRCTHAILSSATPTIERIGLGRLLEERGAVRIHGTAWSPYGGWIRFPPTAPRGYSATRRTLDPLLRRLTAETPGVELLIGWHADELLSDGAGRPTGLRLGRPDHAQRTVHAPLVIGADGRGSTVARLARVPGRTRPNGRFAYWAYWQGVEPSDLARVWFLDPEAVAHFPCEDGLSLHCAIAHERRRPEFARDREAAYARGLARAPGGPDFSEAERVSPLIGMLSSPNIARPPAGPGLAFAGDAALAADPLWGVGCGWAFQTAEWLADTVAPALQDGDPARVDRALRRYSRTFRRRLWPDYLVMCDYSTGRPMRSNERMLYRAGAADEGVGAAMEEIATRRRSALSALDPRLTARVWRAALSAA